MLTESDIAVEMQTKNINDNRKKNVMQSSLNMKLTMNTHAHARTHTHTPTHTRTHAHTHTHTITHIASSLASDDFCSNLKPQTEEHIHLRGYRSVGLCKTEKRLAEEKLCSTETDLR